MDISFSVSAPQETGLKDSYDVVVLGGGPAGLTAGIYTARARLDTLIIEKQAPGGTVMTTEFIENYPGFPQGIEGPELGRAMQEQAQRFGAEIYRGDPEIIDLAALPKRLRIAGKEIKAGAVIIATGTKPRKLNVPGEAELAGRGVSYCATCDGPFFADKELIAVGAGNSGVQESVFLARFASKVTIVEYLPTIQAEQILVDRFKDTGKGSFVLNHQVVAIEGDDKVTGVRIKDRETGNEKVIPAAGVFIWVGLVPQTESLKDKLELDQWGYVKADKILKTSVDGVWAAGDVVSGATRQITAAVGSATTAALEVEHFLSSKTK